MALIASWQLVQPPHCATALTVSVCAAVLLAATEMPLSAATGGRCGRCAAPDNRDRVRTPTG